MDALPFHLFAINPVNLGCHLEYTGSSVDWAE